MNGASPAPETRFAFGENWSSYARTIGQAQIEEAVRGLDAMVGGDAIRGKRFLDIGCGSGLHSLAALRLGAASVEAVDYDPNSVATTEAVLAQHAPLGAVYRVRRADVLAMTPAEDGQFDIVYSWGVLHHTGQMRRAIERAAALVAPGGQLAIALYRKTRLCGFWKWEKRVYCNGGPATRRLLTALYVAVYRLMLRRQGLDFAETMANYKSARGMDFLHDAADWLGGYPYESTDKTEVDGLLQPLGFAEIRSTVQQKKSSGILGSGCDEYVYRKT